VIGARRRTLLVAMPLLAGLALLAAVAATDGRTRLLDDAELESVRGLWIGALEPLPPDPSNRVADDPRAAELGHALFFDSRFSASGEVSCASCHLPERNFTDGLALSQGVGEAPRASMTIAGTAYAPFLFWDGRVDSQWAQALGPLESPVEHGIDRTRVAHLIRDHYEDRYEDLFGPLPDLADARRFPPAAGPIDDPIARIAWETMAEEDRRAVTAVFVNVGKAIAAYERRIVPGPARFDTFAEAALIRDWTAARAAFTADELAGLRLFMGEANCIDCHHGPRFTNDAFHNTGVPARDGLPHDHGRAPAARSVRESEFSCFGAWSDAPPGACGELLALRIDDHALERAFKTPTLRNVELVAPYMHAGQFGSLRDVLEHYRRAPAAPSGHSELAALRLSDRQLDQLEAFLRTLTGPVRAPETFLHPPDAGPGRTSAAGGTTTVGGPGSARP
jgi:cytochrome c peroxidase